MRSLDIEGKNQRKNHSGQSEQPMQSFTLKKRLEYLNKMKEGQDKKALNEGEWSIDSDWRRQCIGNLKFNSCLLLLFYFQYLCTYLCHHFINNN